MGKSICFSPYDGEIYRTVASLFWVVHLTKRTGGLFHKPAVLELCSGPFAQFSNIDCKVFLSRTCLEAPFTIGPRFSLMVGNIFAFSFFVGESLHLLCGHF